jgi:poly(hydroxyalkanoate) granule-associated protein
MVKKLKTSGKADDKQLASAVRTSAQQIWQAGLGAFAKAQEEGGKVFTKLVKEGTDLQKRTQKLAEDKVSDVTGTVTKMADGVSKQATGSWDKLETVFEERVARALTSIGVPTQKDIQLLTQRVEQLSKAVAELSGKKSAPLAKASAKTAPAKASAKAAPAKAPTKATAKAAPVKASAKAAPAGKSVAATAAKPRAKKAVAKVAPEATVNENGSTD